MARYKIIGFYLVCSVMLFCGQQNGDQAMTQVDRLTEARRQMVNAQIAARGIHDQLVLDAMLQVGRHHFVPHELVHRAYFDEPLPIGYKQTISQPYIVAYMTEALGLKGGEKVLEIGTGSGYQAAVLAEIADTVYTIEIVEPLSAQAGEVLNRLGYSNVHCRAGDGYGGWPEEAPFDAIIITAAPPAVPDPLISQLKVGGRLIAPVGEWYQELVLITKTRGGIRTRKLIPVRFVPMTGRVRDVP